MFFKRRLLCRAVLQTLLSFLSVRLMNWQQMRTQPRSTSERCSFICRSKRVWSGLHAAILHCGSARLWKKRKKKKGKKSQSWLIISCEFAHSDATQPLWVLSCVSQIQMSSNTSSRTINGSGAGLLSFLFALSHSGKSCLVCLKWCAERRYGGTFSEWFMRPKLEVKIQGFK